VRAQLVVDRVDAGRAEPHEYIVVAGDLRLRHLGHLEDLRAAYRRHQYRVHA
jgi:hypothetical protein